MEHINEGIQILVERIKTNPEDFRYDFALGRSSKWNDLLADALSLDTITDEEKELLRAEVTKMSRARFTEKVMKALLVEDETSDEGKQSSRAQSIMRMAGQTLEPSLAVPNGGTGITWANTSTSTVIQLGNEVLDENVLRKIKRKLGI